MNPEQPSREQIEARITALLVGELPAAEAELLRFTISRDPELQKLHDQLKVTIGFVREAMHHPAGAQVERETPLKLAQERRQTLLAHFKTTRPQPAQKLSWLRRIGIPSPQSLMVAAIIILVICGLAAIILPNFVKARSTSLSNSIINNLHQIDAAKQEWALEQKKSPDAVPTADDLSPYLADQTIRSLGGEKYVLGKVSEPTVAEINGKQLTAARDTYGSEPSTTSDGETVTHAMRSGPVVENEYKLETGQPHVSPNSQGESTIMQLPKIALPKTESTRTESEQSTIEVYSASVVGYVNIKVPPGATTMVANQLNPAPQTDSDFGLGFGGGPGSHIRENRVRELSGNAAPPPPSVAMATPTPPSPAPEVQPPTGQIFVSPPDSGRTYATNFSELAAGNPGVSVVEVQPGASVPRSYHESPQWGANSAPAPEIVPPPPPASEAFEADTTQAEMPSQPPVSAPQPLPVAEAPVAESANQNASAVNESAGYFTNSVNNSVQGLMQVRVPASASKSENPSTAPLLPPRLRHYGGRQAQEEEQIQPIPAGGTYEMSAASSASAPEVVLQPRDQPNAGLQEAPVTGSNFYAGIGGGGGGASSSNAKGFDWYLGQQVAPQSSVGGASATQFIASANNSLGLSWQANTATWNYGIAPQSSGGGTVSFGSSAGNGAFQNRLQNSVHGAPNNIQPFDFPNQSSTSYATNAIAMNDAMTAVPTLGPVVSREMQNANAAIQNSDGLHHVHNGPINSVSGLPEVAAIVPVVNGVPVAGELIPSSVLRSPPPAVELKDKLRAGLAPLPQQLYAQKEPIAGGQNKSRVVEASEADKKADEPKARPQAANAAIPQPEVLTGDNAFSTFSMNVSDVSFKLAMASLQKGQMPDPASIRSEEFINAFDYHDPEPLQGEPLGFTSERASDPFAHERDFLRFSIKAAAAGRQNGRALNLVLLLDTSGSMERADRVAIIREALRVLSAQLQPQDVISVVTFARTARLWADGIPGNAAGATLDKVGSITPEGGTDLDEAMRLAYETALRHFIAGGMNRVVMLTDGAANLGNVDPQALTQKVDSERRQGIALDCFGIGWDDYNDDLLEQLSSNGDGRYAFINSPDEAATEFAAKLAGALEVAAEDVKVQVEFNPNRVTAWRQIGYAKHQLTKQQFRDNTVAAGAIASREAGNALYVIETNPDGQGPIATVRVRYRVPGTQDVRERSWLVDYDGAAPELAQSSPAMRLAVTAAEISEWMADSPFAQDVTPDELLNYLSGVPESYGTDERPKQLEWMMREAKSVSGK
jgi:secreted protein with Ig-like and vWFA domain